MGNEQSASSVSGDVVAEEENSGIGASYEQKQRATSVSNGDENSCVVIVGHHSSWTAQASSVNNPSTINNGPASVSNEPGKLAISGSGGRRSHSPATRSTSSSNTCISVSESGKTATVSSLSNRSIAVSPFSTRSLRIKHYHPPPTRCSSAMDNFQSTSTGSASPSPQQRQISNFNSSNNMSTNPPPRSPRPAQVCRQRSAVAFSSNSSSALTVNSLQAPTMETVEKSPPLATLLPLSAYQQQQIIQSWPRIQQSGGHTAGAEIFRKLTSKCPPIKETFQKADIIERFAPKSRGFDIYKDHGRILFEVFQTAVNALNDPADEVIELCRLHGARHLCLRGEGFQPRMWDDLSELLVDHVTKLDAVHKHRESRKAWTLLIMYLVNRMKDGYEHGLRKSSSPVVASPFSPRAFFATGASRTSYTDDDLDSPRRRRGDDECEFAFTPSGGRRKMGPRKDDSQQDTFRDYEDK